jgi:hypothetical protein
MLAIEFFPSAQCTPSVELASKACLMIHPSKKKKRRLSTNVAFVVRYNTIMQSHSSPANALLNLTCELKSSQPARSLPSILFIFCSSL